MNFVGKRIQISYDSGLKVNADYLSQTEMKWEALSGPSAGQTGVEKIHAMEIAPEVSFVSWLEESGTTVSNVLDFNNLRVSAFITFPTGETTTSRAAMADQGSFTLR